MRQKSTDIRCAFWRSHAAALAEFPVGAQVALMQVNVCKQGASFEVRATEATEVRLCPDDVVTINYDRFVFPLLDSKRRQAQAGG